MKFRTHMFSTSVKFRKSLILLFLAKNPILKIMVMILPW
ncbi:hypothetical protein LEP1GSC188_1491 [Leptospira weilii serovar Topaz str. LT2116]|uniref:Uncharacterized protein n=1 Tax=Leptospira weilii serovar Topaz str. LT2116 TaxID=1088540 RepID=M3G1G6_9LEPT|nr:hypothetical protein LEP1GSC188_1491 [Leptospira weilii serovar Topaz str. LT2116]